MNCTVCPRQCPVDRKQQAGYCGAAMLPRVARAALHFFEEPPISGTCGSGTVFFSGCNMRCIFCQNKEISVSQIGEPCTAHRLAGLFLSLQQQGAHNINLVTPTPHIPAIKEALLLAKAQGLTLPIVYNSNGYERVEALRSLRSLIDIYLPDMKFVSSELSGLYAGTPDYFPHAKEALLEMHDQVGRLQMDGAGIASRGLLVRHLVLPGCLEDTRHVLDFLKNVLPCDTHIALLRQYTPLFTDLPSPLNRRLTGREYDRAVTYAISCGFTSLFVQDAESATQEYVPEFFRELKDM